MNFLNQNFQNERRDGLMFFQETVGKEEWLTPPEMIRALGEFDLDPCASIIQPWETAKKHYTIEDDGLSHRWEGRVWCNPPYGNQTQFWLRRMAAHGNGIVLVFARTETMNFFRYVWPKAQGIMFLKGRIFFYDVTAIRPKNGPGAPSCLVAYGDENALMLKESGLEGQYLALNSSKKEMQNGKKR